MEKHGYKNISSRNEFEKGFKASFKPIDTKHITKYNFTDWVSQGHFGMPGQTRYFIKELDDLIGASDKMLKPIMKERDPKGYVGW